MQAVEATAAWLRARLKMHLFGFDVCVEHATGVYVVAMMYIAARPQVTMWWWMSTTFRRVRMWTRHPLRCVLRSKILFSHNNVIDCSV